MFDINFYKKSFILKKRLKQGLADKEEAFAKFEEYRSKSPVVFNIETTNLCNMQCLACPRTRMTRPVATMSMKTFKLVVDQLKPWTGIEWDNWLDFAHAHYNYEDMSENHFFLHVISKAIVLHGYGEPLLDRHIVKRVQYLSDKNIPSYFSCNPCNITVDVGIKLFEAGLDYLKFSTDSSDDFSVKQIRGKHADFSKSYKKILQLLDVKETNGYDTEIVITMLNLNKPDQLDDYRRLYKKFERRDVYIYLKSRNARWLSPEKDHGMENQSIHWTEPCQFPWSSISVLSDGSTDACMVDVNNELAMGNVAHESLADIWNSTRYDEFRRKHLLLTENKCTKRCDMKLIGDYSVKRKS